MQWLLYPYQNYADFSGRTSRRQYWMSYLFMMLALLALGAVFGVAAALQIKVLEFLVGAVFVIWALGTIVPMLALHVRRFHDQDLSGWMYLLALIPYAGGIVVLVFMCLPGTDGMNRYGPDPRGLSLANVFT